MDLKHNYGIAVYQVVWFGIQKVREGEWGIGEEGEEATVAVIAR